MSADRNILLELGTISPVVAGIAPVATYSVPEDYFEGFAGALMARMAAGPASETGSGSFYAEAGSGGIESQPVSREFAGDEFPSGSFPVVLAGLHDRPAYEIPAGFFEGFAEKLMNRIKAEEAASPGEELALLSPLLSGLTRKEAFTAPAGYFSELPGNLVAELQALRFVNDELGKNQEPQQNEGPETSDEPGILSPLMNGLKNTQAYIVPQGYFDTLASDVLVRVTRDGAGIESDNAGAKVVPMNSGRRAGMRSWMKYAVAAALTGILVTAGIQIINNNHNQGPDLPTTGDPKQDTGNLAKVSDQEILNYLENQNEPLADVVANSTATLDINDSDVKDFLGDVPDAELQQYVDEHGSSKDPLTN